MPFGKSPNLPGPGPAYHAKYILWDEWYVKSKTKGFELKKKNHFWKAR
jgi:hypothetical protein